MRKFLLSVSAVAIVLSAPISTMGQDGGVGDLSQLMALSQEIMQGLKQKYGDDPEKLKQVLLEAQSNPLKFYSDLSPQQQQKVKKLGESLGLRLPASQ